MSAIKSLTKATCILAGLLTLGIPLALPDVPILVKVALGGLVLLGIRRTR